MRLKSILTAAIVGVVMVPAAFAQTGKAAPQPPKPTATPTVKKMPARDPKTGKFIKATPAPAGKKGGAATGAKKLPPRDPKTGRFMKASPTPPAKKP